MGEFHSFDFVFGVGVGDERDRLANCDRRVIGYRQEYSVRLVRGWFLGWSD